MMRVMNVMQGIHCVVVTNMMSGMMIAICVVMIIRRSKQ